MTSQHTHRGNCQICDSLQAVDNKTGLLAKHGYDVKFGFFNGTCKGAHHQPLQVSKDLIATVIESVKTQVIGLKSLASKVSLSTSPNVSRRVYRNYKWVVEDFEVREDNSDIWNRDTHKCTIAEAIKAYNDKRLSSINREISQLEGYIDWQTQRLANWKPGQLIEAKRIEAQRSEKVAATKAEREAKKAAKLARQEAFRVAQEARQIWTEEKVQKARRQADKLFAQGEHVAIWTSNGMPGYFERADQMDKWFQDNRNTGTITVAKQIRIGC